MTENSVEFDGDVFEEPLPYGEIQNENVSKIRDFKICLLYNKTYISILILEIVITELPRISVA